MTLLACPVCGADLALDARVARCPAGHAFDRGRRGDLTLLAGPAPAGDTAAMVAARETFQAGGHFAPLFDAVVQLVTARAPAAGGVVDVGAGPGLLLAAVLEALPGRDGVAIDVSSAAARRAARAHPRITSVRADVWRGLPVRDGAAAVVLDVFAPRNGPELARVLRPDGLLVVVTPTPRHLREIVDALGLVTVDPRKDERLAAALEPQLALDAREELEWTLDLDAGAVGQLVAMGPSAHHAHGEPAAARVTASVTLAVYRRARAGP